MEISVFPHSEKYSVILNSDRWACQESLFYWIDSFLKEVLKTLCMTARIRRKQGRG